MKYEFETDIKPGDLMHTITGDIDSPARGILSMKVKELFYDIFSNSYIANFYDDCGLDFEYFGIVGVDCFKSFDECVRRYEEILKHEKR